MFNSVDLDNLYKLEMKRISDYGINGFSQYALDELEKAELKARIRQEPPIGQKKIGQVLFASKSLWNNYWSKV